MASFSIGPSGELLALWSTTLGAEALQPVTEQPGWATFPESKPTASTSVLLTVHDSRIVAALHLEQFPVAYPMIQPLPNGRVLAVGARCNWYPGGPDENAVIYDPEGHIEASGTVGDGVQEVMTTPSGQIWVSYFDEGVYGNYGWGRPGPDPIGHCGLIRFSSDFTSLWRFPYGSTYGSIDDCYALNVVGEEAWACYYSDFPIVSVVDGTVRGWTNEIAGARAILIEREHVALAGGYGDEHNRFVRGVLSAQRFVAESTNDILLPGGEPLPKGAGMVGRGNELHVVHGMTWYKLALEETSSTRPEWVACPLCASRPRFVPAYRVTCS
jgi:hypothetical protein